MMLRLLKKHLITGLISFLFIFSLSAQESAKSYNLNINFNPEKNIVKGNEKIIFIPKYNTDHLIFHLYWNGLQEGTELYKGASKKLKNIIKNSDKKLSYTKIENIKINKKNKTEKLSRFKDSTLMKLDGSFLKGKKYTITIKFVSKIPDSRYIRFGYSKKDKIYWFSQWFPKLGVLKGENVWQAKPFYYSYEFFSEYSNYSLQLRVPKEYKAFSNLKEVSKIQKDNTHITYSWENSRILDCSFGISKNIFEYKKIMSTGTFYLYSYDKLPSKRVSDIFTRTIRNMNYMEEKIGPYEYNEFKIVELETIGMHGSGMEYPKLITLEKENYAYYTILDHELCHQWFYSMIGFNQTEEGWLDEGLTSYYEIRLSDLHNTKKILGLTNFDFHYIPTTILWGAREKSFSNVMVSPCKKDVTSSEVMLLYYYKMPIILKFLESEIGTKKFDKIINKLYSNYSFKHPTTKNFLNLLKNNIDSQTYDIFYKNLTTNALTDVKLSKKDTFVKIEKGKDYNKEIKLFLNKKDGSQEEKTIQGKIKKIDRNKVDSAYIKIIDHNLGNNFIINSSRNKNLIILSISIIIFFGFISHLIKKNYYSNMLKNLFYNLIIFSPFYIYLIIKTFNISKFSNFNLGYSYLSPMLNRILLNIPITLFVISFFFFLIKISIFSIKTYKKENAEYSLVNILLIDLVAFFIIGLYILTLLFTKSFSLIIFMLFILVLGFIEPIKIYYLNRNKKILHSLTNLFPAFFTAILISWVSVIIFFTLLFTSFIKNPLYIVLFIIIFSFIEQLYRIANYKIIEYRLKKLGRNKNEN